MLPSVDQEYLRKRFPGFSVAVEEQMICVVLPGFPLPSGLPIERSDLLLRLSPGYPDVAPDMWWFDPPVLRGDGQPFPQTQVQEAHLGRNWQRWSRHFESGQWRPGADSLESYIALVQSELSKAQ